MTESLKQNLDIRKCSPDSIFVSEMTKWLEHAKNITIVVPQTQNK